MKMRKMRKIVKENGGKADEKNQLGPVLPDQLAVRLLHCFLFRIHTEAVVQIVLQPHPDEGMDDDMDLGM